MALSEAAAEQDTLLASVIAQSLTPTACWKFGFEDVVTDDAPRAAEVICVNVWLLRSSPEQLDS